MKFLADDNWEMVTRGGHEIGASTLRYRTSIPEPEHTASYPRLIRVTWIYGEQGSLALPSSETIGEMSTFEDRLCASWEEDGLAVLTAVLTYDGARTWLFYSKDEVGELQERIQAMPQEPKPYPIELLADLDPGWRILREDYLRGRTLENP